MHFQIYLLFFIVLFSPSFICLAQTDSLSIYPANKTLKRSTFVGAELGTLTNPVRVAYKMKVEKGIVVYKVFPNLAADKAGLQEKDVIIAIDSTHLHNIKEFQELIKTKKGNDTLNLFFIRNDTVRKTSLVLHFFPRETNFYFETMYDQIELDSQISLRTIMTFPRTNTTTSEITQFPLVIILNSASTESIEREIYAKKNNSKTHYQFYDWIETLTKNGFATLRIEKKGIGDSEGKLNEWTFEDEQKSLQAALEKIKKYGAIQQQEIYLIALGSSSFVGLENFIQKKLDTAHSKIDFKTIFIEKLPSQLQKTKNQTRDSLLLYFPEFRFFDKNYSQKIIDNLKEYNLILDNKKFFWIESKDDILRVLSRLKRETE